MSWREEAKKRAALEAVKLVQNGSIVGLGSGSTIAYAIQEIGRKIREESLKVLGIPTSYQASMLAVESGVPLTTLNEHPKPDLAIDGADQIDPQLNLIKGMGGALTQEKVVDSTARRLVIIADETKMVERLGTNQPVPLEILPFALAPVTLKVQEVGGKPVLREGKGKVGPVVTDNGNFILDVDFGPITEPKELNLKLKSIPGVIETGLFIELADTVYVGTPTTVRRLRRR